MTAAKPLVSVLLPVYNGQDYLRKAIPSILSQTYENFELLIADDLSTDDSFAIIQEFAKQDNRIKHFKNAETLGHSGNYNFCLDQAKGDFYKSFAQDDLLEPTCIEQMLDVFLREPDVTLVSCARRWIDPNGKDMQVVRPYSSDMKLTAKEVILYNILVFSNWIGEPSSSMVRRVSPPEPRFDLKNVHFADVEYLMQVAARGAYYYLDKPLCLYRRHQAAMSKVTLRGMYFAPDLFDLWRKYRPYLEEIESEEQFARRACEHIAKTMDYVVRTEKLTLPAMLNAKVKHMGGLTQQENIAAFREVSYHMLGYITEVLQEIDHLKHCRKQNLAAYQDTINEIHSSLSWKVSAPLRALRRPHKTKTEPPRVL